MTHLPQYVFDLTGVYGPQIVLISSDGQTTSSIYIDNTGVLRAAENNLTTPSALSLYSYNGTPGGMALIEHFLAAEVNGSQNWIMTTNGPEATSKIVSGEIGHPGIVSVETGKASNGRSAIHLGLSSLTFGSGSYTYRGVIKITELSNSSQTYSIRIGFAGSVAYGDVSNGIYVEYDQTISDNWLFKSAKNGIRTTLDSGIQVGVGWTSVRIKVVDDVLTIFQIDEFAEVDISTNIPTESVGVFHKIESSKGKNSKNFLIDSISLNFK